MDPFTLIVLLFGFLAGGFFLLKKKPPQSISSSSTDSSAKQDYGQKEKQSENSQNENLRHRLKSDPQDEGVEPKNVLMRVKNYEEISSTVAKSSGSELQSSAKPMTSSVKPKVPEPERKAPQIIKPITHTSPAIQSTSNTAEKTQQSPLTKVTPNAPPATTSIVTQKTVLSIDKNDKSTHIHGQVTVEKTVYETEGEDTAIEQPAAPIKDQLAKLFQMRMPGKSTPPVQKEKERSPVTSNTSRPLATEAQKQRSTPTKRKPPTKNRRATLQSIEKKGEMEERGRDSVSSKILGETVGSMGVLASLGLHMQAERAKREERKQALAEKANMKAKEMVFVAAQEVKLKTSDENNESQTRLIHIKGRRRLSVRLVETHLSSLNDGDSFILEHGNALYNWNGKAANKMEVAKSFDIARRMNTKEKGCRGQIIVLHQKEVSEQQESKYKAFFKLLGHTEDSTPEIRSGSELPEDEEYDKINFGDKLYIIHRGHDGSFALVDVSADKLGQELLNSSKVYLLDCTNEIFVWNGKQSGVTERKWAYEYAKSLQNTAGRVPWTRVSRETDGAETILFKEKFWNFKDELPIAQQKKEASPNIAARREDKFDVNTMYKYNPANKPEVQIDDGEGKIQKMWRVDLNNKLEFPSELYGHFFEEDSFIIWYKYKETLKQLYATSISLAQRDKDKHLLYFWQGRKSGIKKKGWSALLTADLGGSNFVTGEIMQLRIPQQLESTHFVSMCGGCVIVHKGHYSDYQKRDENQLHLYQARGVPKKSLRIVEVEPVTKFLNTNDVFVLQHANMLYVWIGKASTVYQNSNNNNDIKQMTDLLKGNRQVETFIEGEEPSTFWNLLGGKSHYFQDSFQDISLFHCHVGTGRFQADPVYEICQDELVEKDMMILDTSQAVFVWKGSKTVQEKEKQTLELALEYIDKDPRWNRKDCPVYFVESGHEPYLFTASFQAWDTSKTKSTPELNDLKLVRDLVRELNRTYTLEELKQKPKGLDPNKLEFFLSDDEFFQVFGMTKGEYTVFPAWKRDSLRKKNGLF